MASVDVLSTEDNSHYGYTSINAIKNIWYGSQIHQENNARYDRFKISDHIRKTKNEWKGAEFSEKSMGKYLHIIFKPDVNELNNALPHLVESVSEVSHFIS